MCCSDQLNPPVISDTHGLLRPEVEQRLAGVAHIVHVGDIGSPNVIAGLQRIAAVVAIRGSVDTGHWAEQYPTNAWRTSDAPTKLNW
jgi:predicted phosphodiesterase